MTAMSMSADERTPTSVTIPGPLAPDAGPRDAITIRDLRLPECAVVVYGCAFPGPGVEERFAAELLEALAGVDGHWGFRARRIGLVLRRSPLGQPLLLVDGLPGPAISLSRASGFLWGAASASPGVGIDVALRDEFVGPYPYHRAFGYPELSLATGCLGPDLPLAAAGLWAVKEAAVKAAGTGFHGFDPRDVKVLSLEAVTGGYLSHVQVGFASPVWLSREAEGWLAVALATSVSPIRGRVRNDGKRHRCEGRDLAVILKHHLDSGLHPLASA